CVRIYTKLTAGRKLENSTYPCAAREALTLRPFAINERFCQKLTRWMRRSCLICLARSSMTGLDMSHILFMVDILLLTFFFFQAEDGIRVLTVTGVQTCALPI